jgi:hypothetical protein
MRLLMTYICGRRCLIALSASPGSFGCDRSRLLLAPRLHDDDGKLAIDKISRKRCKVAAETCQRDETTSAAMQVQSCKEQTYGAKVHFETRFRSTQRGQPTNNAYTNGLTSCACKSPGLDAPRFQQQIQNKTILTVVFHSTEKTRTSR